MHINEFWCLLSHAILTRSACCQETAGLFAHRQEHHPAAAMPLSTVLARHHVAASAPVLAASHSVPLSAEADIELLLGSDCMSRENACNDVRHRILDNLSHPSTAYGMRAVSMNTSSAPRLWGAALAAHRW